MPKAGPAAERATETVPPAAAPPKQNLPEFDRIKEKWGQVLQQVKSISIPAHGLLSDVVPVDVRDGSLVLSFKSEGLKNLIAKETDKGKGISKRQALLTAIERVFGVANAGIICEVRASEGAPAPAASIEDDEDLPDPFEDTGQEPLKDVLDIFPDANVVDN